MRLARPLRVVHVESPSQGRQGDRVYRTLQPCEALGALPGVEVLSGTVLSPEIHARWREADVLVLCDVVDADCLPLLAERRAAGRPTVYELNDDFRAPHPHSPTGYLSQNLLTRSLSAQLARRSTALQLTTRELLRRFGALNPRSRCLPNQLEAMPPPPPPRGELVIGWGGSRGHLEDVRAVMPAVLEVLRQRPAARLHLMGAQEYRALAQGLPPERFRFVPAGDLAAYLGFVSTLSIGLAPNLPTDFNRCRSDVKYLEYAAHGVVPVCADLEPYRESVRSGHNGVLYASPEELERWLLRLIDEPDLRARLAQAAIDDVRTTRLEALHAPARLAWLLEGTSRDGLPGFEGLAPGGHRRAPESAASELLYTGLVLARDGHPAQAVEAYEQAAREAPDFHLPHLYLGQVHPEPQRAKAALHQALRLQPSSAAALLLLGERCAEANELAEAAEAFERCHALCPDLGAPLFRLGNLAAAAGRAEEAVRRYEFAHEANPYFAAPAVQLASQALEAGRLDRAVAWAQDSVAHDDRLWSTHYLLGRAFLGQRRFDEACVHLERALEQCGEPRGVLALLAKAHLAAGREDKARQLLALLSAKGS